MNDLSLDMGGDLALTDVGALIMVDGSDATTQRVLRRILTNVGGYIWHPKYGAGLPRRIGDPLSAAEIRAIVFSQMLLETGVARTPRPTVNLTQLAVDKYFLTIRYTDLESGRPVVFTFAPNE